MKDRFSDMALLQKLEAAIVVNADAIQEPSPSVDDQGNDKLSCWRIGVIP